MIVDASAILAILFQEPEGEAFENLLLKSPGRHEISPINYLEGGVRVDGMGSSRKSSEYDRIFSSLAIDLTTITPEQAHFARAAYQKFGKGFHPAKLNLGDCFAYALSKARNEPLLFKGDDFPQTDVEAAI